MFGKLGGEKSCIVVYGPLGLPSARPMAQALRLPFEYKNNNFKFILH